MGRISWPDKYPDEELTNTVDWSHRVTGDITIASEDFEVLTGDVTLGDQGTDEAVTFVQVLGGTGTGIVEVLCKVVLSSGDKWSDIAEFRMLEPPTE
jgi:hypothetical protein